MAQQFPYITIGHVGELTGGFVNIGQAMFAQKKSPWLSIYSFDRSTGGYKLYEAGSPSSFHTPAAWRDFDRTGADIKLFAYPDFLYLWDSEQKH